MLKKRLQRFAASLATLRKRNEKDGRPQSFIGPLTPWVIHNRRSACKLGPLRDAAGVMVWRLCREV